MIERNEYVQVEGERPALTQVERLPTAESSETETVVVDRGATGVARTFRLTEAIYFVFGIIEGLIAIRLVLRILAANPTAQFASAIYTVTDPLVAPFQGIFGSPQFQGSVLEPDAIVALVMYVVLGALLVKIVEILFMPTRTESASRVRSVRTRR